MKMKMKYHKIPETNSILELTRFWDTHDLTDFEDELEKVYEPVFERNNTMKIHLQPEEAEAVKTLAKSKGISYDDLIHEWVVEKIHTSL